MFQSRRYLLLRFPWRLTEEIACPAAALMHLESIYRANLAANGINLLPMYLPSTISCLIKQALMTFLLSRNTYLHTSRHSTLELEGWKCSLAMLKRRKESHSRDAGEGKPLYTFYFTNVLIIILTNISSSSNNVWKQHWQSPFCGPMLESCSSWDLMECLLMSPMVHLECLECIISASPHGKQLELHHLFIFLMQLHWFWDDCASLIWVVGLVMVPFLASELWQWDFPAQVGDLSQASLWILTCLIGFPG